MNTHLASRALVLGALLLPACVLASSHREAPAIGGTPRLDGTDFYMFRSYEPGRSGFVTFIANYIPLEDAYGGPNYFPLDTNADYRINIDTTGNANPDLQVTFKFTNTVKDLAVKANGKSVAVPLINIGPITAAGTNLNVSQSYIVAITRGGTTTIAENATLGGTTFYKPADNIGNKSIPDYAAYASGFTYAISIPGCATPGRVFVGQRKEGFVANLGEIFDLVNLNPVGPRNANPNVLKDKNVTSLALELPISCVARSGQPIIGAWTTADTVLGSPQTYTQVSRLGMPLVNELVIGLPDKDNFNGSAPRNDAAFLTYVTNPSLPVLLNALFGNAAVIPASPRNDLVAAFLTGVKGINQPPNVNPSEMLRLNTSTPPTPPASQKDLGVLAGDLAGFPNGRRPYDDVVDITLRVAEGALCGAIGSCGTEMTDPNHGAPYTDGAEAAGPDPSYLHVSGAISAGDTYLPGFPYLATPLPGSPNAAQN